MILLGGIRCEVPGAPDTKNPLDNIANTHSIDAVYIAGNKVR